MAGKFRHLVYKLLCLSLILSSAGPLAQAKSCKDYPKIVAPEAFERPLHNGVEAQRRAELLWPKQHELELLFNETAETANGEKIIEARYTQLQGEILKDSFAILFYLQQIPHLCQLRTLSQIYMDHSLVYKETVNQIYSTDWIGEKNCFPKIVNLLDSCK